MANDGGVDQLRDRIPPGLLPSSGSLNFTRDTIPDALQREHTLAAGHWGVLHVFRGCIRFVDCVSGNERLVVAPDLVVIHPQSPHRVVVDQDVRCRVDFFRDPETSPSVRTPGGFAESAVRLSFERCEANGDFAETFYRAFFRASPEIPPYFATTHLARQRRLLRNSVHMMVTKDVADPQMRAALEHLGRAHGRGGRNVLPKHYEQWLDCICETVKALDPQWNDDLERMWRVRLRPGMQIIMAAY